MVKVAIWERHPVTRAGLRQVISEHVDLRLVCEASSEAAALAMSDREEIDVLLLDFLQQDQLGIEALSSIRRARPALNLLVFTAFPALHGAIPSLREGVRGYLNKSCPSSEIVEAIRTIARGQRYFSREVTEVLARQLNRDGESPLHDQLSERELQVFYQLAKGQTAATVAAAMAVSVKTVSTYRTRLLQKLGLSSNSDLTYYAFNNRLIK